MEPLTPHQILDLVDAMTANGGNRLLSSLTRANHDGSLPELLESLGLLDLLETSPKESNPFEGRVIVLGSSTVKEDKLRSMVRKAGLDPRMFEFRLNYDSLKHFDFGKIRHSMGYRAIFAGPMPHSTPGTGGASSFIARVENHPDEYPPMFKLMSGNELKITNNSFKRALASLREIFGWAAAYN